MKSSKKVKVMVGLILLCAVTAVHADVLETLWIALPGAGFSPVVADIDADGTKEIVLRVNGGSYYDNRLYVLSLDDLNPMLVPDPCSFPDPCGLPSVLNVPALVDLGGGSELEIVVGTATSEGGLSLAFSSDGSEFVDYSGGWPDPNQFSTASPAVFDGDKITAIAEIYGGDPCENSMLSFFGYDATGAPVTGWPVSADAEGTNRGASPAVGDIDGDGEDEIVFPAVHQGKLFAYEMDGTAVTGWETGIDVGMFVREPVITDLTGDGDNEIIAVSAKQDSMVTVLNGDGTTEGSWSVTGEMIVRGPAVGDLDGDGEMEIVTGVITPDPNGIVYAWNPDGTLLKSWELEGDVWSVPVIADIDGDDFQEVIVPADDGMLYALNHENDTPVAGFPVTFDAGVKKAEGSACVADMDNDGYLEIALATYGDASTARLWIWKLDVAFNRYKADWPMHRQNIGNTAFLPNPMILCDFNNDRKMDIEDLAIMGANWTCVGFCNGTNVVDDNTPPNEVNYFDYAACLGDYQRGVAMLCDLNGDFLVDIEDLALAAANWTCNGDCVGSYFDAGSKFNFEEFSDCAMNWQMGLN